MARLDFQLRWRMLRKHKDAGQRGGGRSCRETEYRPPLHGERASKSPHRLFACTVAAALAFAACVQGKPVESAIQDDSKGIVGGTSAQISEFPWQVSLQDTTGWHLCGGSIIAKKWVLTAQHCLDDDDGRLYSASDLRIVAGIDNLHQSSTGQIRSVARIIRYPGYSGTTTGRDVALLELSSHLDLSGASSRAIPLVTTVDAAAGRTDPGIMGTVTGWGALYYSGWWQSQLMQVSVPIVSIADAQTALGISITPDQLPAGYIGIGGKDTCQGDSGGPLVVKVRDRWKLAGVVSWGEECGHPDFPGLYARVSSFADWIGQYVQLPPDDDGDGIPNSDGDLCPCDPDEVNPQEDRDIDGFCGACNQGLSDYCKAHCRTAVVDNCPNVWNPDQRNTNWFAEKARGATVLGDACDPVPSPSPAPLYQRACTKTLLIPGVPGIYRHDCETTLQYFAIGKAAVPIGVGDTSVPSADYRFCSETDQHPGFCARPNLVDDRLLKMRSSYREELRDDPWRRISTEATALDLDAQDIAPEATLYAQCSPSQTCTRGAAYTRTWDYDLDSSASRPHPFSSPVQGTVWFHTSSELGMTIPHPSLGLHYRLPPNETLAADSLSNSYLHDVNVRRWSTAYTFPVNPGEYLAHRVVIPQDCIACGLMRERPHDWIVNEALFLVRTRLPETRPLSYVTGTGILQEVTGAIATAAQQNLTREGLVWASPSHLTTGPGMAASMPVAVALDAQDGTRVVDILWPHDGMLLGLGDIALDESLRSTLAVLGIDLELPPAHGMIPRSAFRMAYDAARGVVYVVGGDTRENPAGDIWAYSFPSRTWVRVPLEKYRPDQVLAAIVAPDGRLWVSDFHRGEQVRRFAVVDPQAGTSTLLLTTDASSSPTEIMLSLDYEGGVLATCSNESGTWVFQLEGEQELRVPASAYIPEPVAAEPIADPRGLKLLGVSERYLKVERLAGLEPGEVDAELFGRICAR